MVRSLPSGVAKHSNRAIYDALSDLYDLLSASQSSGNSSSTIIAPSGTFSGAWEQNDSPDVLVSLKTDADGTLYVEFSVDGTNADTSLSFAVTGGTGEFHTFVKGPRYCRVRFVNGSGTQTYFRMGVYYGAFRQPNSALNNAVQQDADAITVRNIDPYIMLKQGFFTGYSMDTKFGRNTNVSSTGEDVWNGGGTYTGQPASGNAETIEVFSSDAADAAAGTGARTVRLYGLDANYAEQTADVTLNGVTPVVTTGVTWRRMNRMKVLTAGSGGANAGTITARHTTTTANVFAVMPIGNNQTANCAWTVPAGYNALIKRVYAAGARANGAVIADMSLRIRDFGGVYRANRLFTVGNGVEVNISYFGGILLEEKTDVKMRVESASANSGDFCAEFGYVLIKQ